ncbi:MAG: hypothetical protein J3Q66DRAFT_420570 [Benniella sp.]|nr:MAG: hypothetical protein J3Q66DRAFT_420570 [Benniella sp.]
MAASVDVNGYLVQTFRSRSMEEPINIPVQIDSATQKGFILWQDIERVFGEPKYVKRRSSMVVVFIRDSNFQNVLPLRIDHFPGEELEVVVEHSIHFAASREHAEPTEASPPSPARNTDDASRIITIDSNTNTIDQSSSATSSPATPQPLRRLYASRSPEMSGEEKEAVAMACVEQTMERPPPGIDKGILSPELVLQIVHQLQEEFLGGQHQMKQFYRRSQEQLLEKHNQLHELQLRAREESRQQHQVVVDMQHQIIDRLTLIQTRLQALLTQTFELHEYPIPRLFIVVPKELRVRDKLAKPFAEQFRLYFLCECGSHIHNTNSMIPNQIHLAKHEGYDVDRPTEFFQKYGTYIMAMMYMIKYGIAVSGVVVPQLVNLNFVGDLGSLPGHLKYLKKNIVPLVEGTISFIQGVNGHGQGKARNGSASIPAEYTSEHGHSRSEPAFPAEFDASTGVLEGADLRQLESFLKVKDKGRVLGNLYRMVTDEGHVKWVCFDHYRANYRESAIKALDEVVQSYKGTYCQETGTIEIELGSHFQAKHFYDAMVKGRGIQELNITFGWDASMDDLRHFAAAALKAGLVRVSVDGVNLKRPPLDITNRRRRFEPLLQLAFNNRIQSLELRNIDRFFVRVGDGTMKRAPMLRVFALDSEIPFAGKTTDSYFHIFLEDCPFLVSLELKLNRQYSIQYATTEILTKLRKLEKLKLDCGAIAIQAAITYGKIQDINMTIVRLCDLSTSDVEFIHQNYVSQLAIEYTPQSPDDNRLVDILDNSSRLNHLRIGCQDRRFGALINLVVGTRSKMLQDQGSPSLQTFELMDEGLVPFNEKSDFDTKTHIHCVLTFKEDNEFEMCSQVRLQCYKLVTDEDPICDFIRQYGSSIVFFDAPLTFSNHLAAILDEMTSSGAPRLKKFSVDPLGLSKPGLKHLHSILKRLANSSDLGLYMDDERNADKPEKVHPLLRRASYAGAVRPLTRSRSASSQSASYTLPAISPTSPTMGYHNIRACVK